MTKRNTENFELYFESFVAFCSEFVIVNHNYKTVFSFAVHIIVAMSKK